MKLPKATKLKSGSWRIQLQIDGERYSCTGSTKKEAQEKAKQIYAGIELEKRVPLTLGKAIDKYIETKTATLSPSTIRGYKSVRRNYDGQRGTYTIIAAFDSKEKAMSLAKELADNRASMYNTTSQKLSSGYEARGNYYLVEEMSIK